ncbi:MAG: polysaccharide deacetylase family protein [Bacteroidetes bacterium]|nr:polysaccharide deacetylase family protein [Bacteroidota bacterium]
MKNLFLGLINLCFLGCHSNVPTIPAKDTISTVIQDTVIQKVDSVVSKPTMPDTAHVIYLTFDDGPLIGTENVIEVMNNFALPATMFMVGKHTQADKEMQNSFLMAYNDNLLQVSSHSYSHANNRYRLFYQNPQGVLEDFNKSAALLHLQNKDARLPGRNTWRVGSKQRNDPAAHSQQAADLLKENGYSLFGWDIEWQHYDNGEPIQTVSQLLRMITNAIQDSSRCFTPHKLVLLSHDQMFAKKENKEKLIELINGLKAKGYRFELIKNYPRG